MDEIDQAQQNEEIFRQNSLNRHFGRTQNNQVKSRAAGPAVTSAQGDGPGPGTHFCAECGDEIDAGRMEANPHAIRCFECQAKHERKRRAEGMA